MPDHSLANPEIRRINRRKAVNDAHIAPMTRHPDVFSTKDIGAIEGEMQDGEWLGGSSSDWSVSVSGFRQNILRLTLTPRGVDEQLLTYALPSGTVADAHLEVTETKDHYEFVIEAGKLVLAKASGEFRMLDSEDTELLRSNKAPEVLTSIMAGTVELNASFDIKLDDAFHALGDKPGQLDMRGRNYTLWNTDAFGYDQKSDALYKAIPFVLLERRDKRVGLFFNNTFRSSFDFGREDVEVFRYATEGGSLDLFIIFGDDPVQICADYCRLTGTPPLPPIWALGYQQCRWSYYPESRVREVAAAFRQQHIPCDAIYLDIDYMESYKCFTWSEILFPHLGAMIADLREMGMRTVVMIDPGISAVDFYDVYENGTYENVWCRRTSGEIMRGPVWPDECVFPDFTRPEVREWWGALYEELYVTQGVSGFWNDMNEPAVFKVDTATFPDEVMHNMDGHPSTHARAHNVYGLKMTEASYEGLRKLKPTERPFLLTRASFSGGQRYAATWTGDNTASWRHLQIANHQVIRLSLSGFSLAGSDIGGFHLDPDGELYSRWIQLAIFHPVMRTHSMGTNADGSTQTDQESVKTATEQDRRDQEPWSYGEPWTSLARQAIEWRYRLLPTLYTAIEACHRQGTPVLVPIYMDEPDNHKLIDKQAFRCGEHLLVDPITRQGQSTKQIDFPQGLWYQLQSGEIVEGDKRHTFDSPAEFIPCWVRGGAVMQLDPIRQSTAEAYPSNPELHLYFGEGMTQSTLYQDAGEGYAHEQGDYLRSTFTYESKGARSVVKVQREGNFVPPFDHYEIVWHGKGEGEWQLSVDGAKVDMRPVSKTYRARVRRDFQEMRVELQPEA